MTAYSDLGKKTTNEMIEPLREKMIGRELMYVNTRISDKALDSIEAFEYSDLGDALIKRGLPDDTIFRDGLRTATHTVLLNTIVEGFLLERQEFNNYVNNGIPIDTTIAMVAADKVAEKENEAALVGWSLDGTVYTQEGMKELTGKSTESTSKDFGTFGYPLDKTILAIDVLNDAGVYADSYNLTLNKTQYGELRSSISTTGESEWDLVMGALNEGGSSMGKIRKSSDVTATTGFLTPVDPTGKYFQMYETYSPTASFGYDSKLGEEDSPVYGKVYERVGFDWKQPTAVCYISAI